MDLAERLEALAQRNSEPLPVPDTWDLTDEELKERYLELISDGVVPDAAARHLKKTGSWFRKFRNSQSSSYDEDFALRYDLLRRPGGEYTEALSERALAAMVKAAEDGNVRAAEKILMAYHPHFSFLRPAAFAGDTYNVDKLVQIMPGIPTHLLEQMISALEEEKRLALPVVDAA